MADPIGKTGCVGWWKETAAADNTTTTSWADDSGAGNTVANASSVITNQTGELFGLPVQRFNGAANSWLRKTTAALSGMTSWTCAFAHKPAIPGTAPADTIIAFGDVTGGGPEITVNATKLQVYPAAGSLATSSTTGMVAGTVYRYVVTCTTGGLCAVYLNGAVDTLSPTARTFDYTTSPVVLMGAITATPTEMYNGDLGEVVLYNSVADSTEIAALFDYLTRWTTAAPVAALPILVMAPPR